MEIFTKKAIHKIDFKFLFPFKPKHNKNDFAILTNMQLKHRVFTEQSV